MPSAPTPSWHSNENTSCVKTSNIRIGDKRQKNENKKELQNDASLNLIEYHNVANRVRKYLTFKFFNHRYPLFLCAIAIVH